MKRNHSTIIGSFGHKKTYYTSKCYFIIMLQRFRNLVDDVIEVTKGQYFLSLECIA